MMNLSEIILQCVAKGAACTNLRHAQVMYKLLTGRFPSRVASAGFIFFSWLFFLRYLGNMQEDIFDDKPGENWVGSPAMKRRGI